MPSMSRSTTRNLRTALAAVALCVGLLPAAPNGQQPWQPARLSDGQPDVQGDWDPEVHRHVRSHRSASRRRPARRDSARAEGHRPRAASRAASSIRRTARFPTSRGRRPSSGYSADHADTPTAPEHIDPQARCLAGGVPREMFHSQVRILQSPGQVVILQFAEPRVPRDPARRASAPRPAYQAVDGRLARPLGRHHARRRRHQPERARAGSTWSATSSSDTVARRRTLRRSSMRTRSTTGPRSRIRRSILGPGRSRSKFVRGKRGQGEEYWEDACHEGERSADAMIIQSPDASGERERRDDEAAVRRHRGAGAPRA